MSLFNSENFSIYLYIIATPMADFGFKSIELLKNQPLGTGSYGAVYKVRCDELLCAAKIIHPTLFLDDPGARNIPLEKFQQECRLLCAVKHPNIVQYLGTCREPDTGHLVLLMELCHERLTGYLKNSPRTFPYHFQVSLCHDIALALVYLHTNGLIHRDLSSNNILLMKDHRAKITDFGMHVQVHASESSTHSTHTLPRNTSVYASRIIGRATTVYT